MKILTVVHSVSEASTVEFVYVELTGEVVELLRKRVEFIREAIAADDQFLRMSFRERSPELIFKLQDDLRPFGAEITRTPTWVQLPDNTVFSTSTEKEGPDVGVLRIRGRGFSWRLKPKTARYEVETGLLPWSIIAAL